MSGGPTDDVSCVNCRFFERQGDEPDLDKGARRWFPPAAGYDAEAGEVATCWPTVDWMDWCGEYDARPPSGRATVLGR